MIRFMGTHPKYPSNTIYETWEAFCDATINIATESAKQMLMPQLITLIEKVSDEMIETVQEVHEATA